MIVSTNQFPPTCIEFCQLCIIFCVVFHRQPIFHSQLQIVETIETVMHFKEHFGTCHESEAQSQAIVDVSVNVCRKQFFVK